MISIWLFDNLSLQHFEEVGESFDKVYRDGWTIRISQTLLEKLYFQRKAKLPNETGGVLIGSFDFAHEVCYIVDSIISPPDSLEYPYAYIRGCDGLLDRISKIDETTIGNLVYIGEWHSHPTASTQASKDDLILLASIKEYTRLYGTPGVMLIVGEEKYSLYIDP